MKGLRRDYAVFERVERVGTNPWRFEATAWIVTFGAEGPPAVHSPAVHTALTRWEARDAVREEIKSQLATLRRIKVLPSQETR